MEMTIKERIDRFCEKYTEPEQYEIELYWNRADGRHSQRVGGDIPLKIYYGDRIYHRSVGKDLYIQHYLYDDETQLMECSYSKLDCHTPKANDNRKWEYAERYFIPKEEKQVYRINGETGPYYVHASYSYYVRQARQFLQAFVRLSSVPHQFHKEFMRLTDGNVTVPPSYGDRETYYPWILTEWIRYNVKPRVAKKGGVQDKIDKMLEKDLGDESIIKDAITSCVAKNDNQCYWCYQNYAYFDKVNMVFRIYQKANEELVEKKRVYFDKNGKFIFAKFYKGKWVPNGSFTYNQFNSDVVNKEDLYGLPHYDYLRNVSVHTVYKIVSVMRRPEIEQFYNMGMTNIAEKAAHSDNVNSWLKDNIGEADKKKNVCQKYHMTKQQFSVLNDKLEANNYYGIKDIVKITKICLGTDDLSHVDIESFKKYINAAKEIGGGYYSCRTFLGTENKENLKKMFIRLSNMLVKNQNAIQVFRDIIRMDTGDVDIYNIHSYGEMVRTHDMLVELERIRRTERERLWNMEKIERDKELEKKMVKVDEERAKLNYEEDDYLIRLPNNLSEIVNEGHDLRHCVGGYTEGHASGGTTIMFLRRKSEPNKSFYTIEVRNKNIVQIHGFGNRWLGNDADAIPTVVRWLRKNDIRCERKILLCKATGYGSTSAMVDEKVLNV